MNLKEKINENIRNLPPSGIRKYFDLLNEMKDAISLGVGEPDFITPLNIRNAGIKAIQQGHTHYSSNAGFIEIRREIENYMKRKFELSYSAVDEILVTVGGSEAIDLALRALVGPGDEVIIPEPSFVAYQGCTAFTGATPVSIDLKDKDEFRLTPELLDNAITNKTKLLVLAFPNNPTGAIMEKEDLDKIVEILKDKEIIIISDEIYAELTYKNDHVSIASYPEMKDKTIIINGFSKAFAMTGWRLGFACGHKDIIDEMKKIHQYSLMCSPTISQYAAIEALQNGNNDVKRMANEYNKRRRVIVDGFRSAGLSCFEPLGAFYAFPCIKSTGLSSEDFCERLLIEEKVLIVPGKVFGKSGEGFIRATYANSMENINESIRRITRFVKKIKKV